MRIPIISATASALLLAAAPGVQASPITFDIEQDYTLNFRESSAPGNVLWQAGGYIENQVASPTAPTLVYDTTPADSSTINVVTDPVSVDFHFTSGNAQFGLAIRVPQGEANGWTILVSTHSGGSQDHFRLYRNGDFSTGALGNAVSAANYVNTGTNFLDLDTWYTLVVTQTETGSGFTIDASIYEQGTGNQIAALETWSVADTHATYLPPGQVGARFFARGAMDNFHIVIPEPMSLVLLSVGGLMMFRRRTEA